MSARSQTSIGLICVPVGGATFQKMNGPMHRLSLDESIGLHQRPNMIIPPGSTTPSYAQQPSLTLTSSSSWKPLFGEKLPVDELAGELFELIGSKYFIIVMRCQPGISCCGGSGCRIPVQWNGNASAPEPLNWR